MLFGSVGAFANRTGNKQLIEISIAKQAKPEATKKILVGAFVVGWYEFTTHCGDTWSCLECPNYTDAQLGTVQTILESLCGTNVAEIYIYF